MPNLVRHDQGCPKIGMGHSDEAMRVWEAYHLHRTADLHGSLGKWIACALQDGRHDNQLYDSKRDAVTHQHHNEQYYTFIQITRANMSVCAAEVMLDLARRMYSKGIRMTDPDHASGGRDVIRRLTTEDQVAMSKGRITGLILPSKN